VSLPTPRRVAVSCTAAVLVWMGRPASAQTTSQEFALDTVVSVDTFRGDNVSDRPQVIVDVSGGVRIGEYMQAYVRPWFRLPRPNTPTSPAPPWSKELYAAGIRYERPGEAGRPAARVEIGYNVSPIGLGIMDTRPSLNPTIAPHVSYLSPMPPFESTVPRVSAISATYPFGGQVTLSSDRWDARGAIINAAPTRIYSIGRPIKPRPTPAWVMGAGLTPVAGLRLGASYARGNYATDEEVGGASPTDRSVSIVSAEGEYAFRYTRVAGEIVRSRFERSVGTAIAYEWFIQGLQTLTPRWFVAARHEGTQAPPLVTPTVTGQKSRMSIAETTVGFRITPEVTLRGSYYARRSYGASVWDNQAGVSAVWARKWW
jgi:hypothetical protein